jgi:heterodisulfide reductase subunit A
MNIGVYICHCGINIAGVVDVEEVARHAAGLKDVVVARDYKYMCSSPGQDLIKNDINEKKLDRIIVAACSPNMHEKTFRTVLKKTGLNPFLLEIANIREQNSWVHSSKEEATQKAKDLIRMAVAKARFNEPLEKIRVEMVPKVLVIGGGIAGMEASIDITELGYDVVMVEKEQSIGGHMSQLTKTFPTLDCAACILTPKMVLTQRDGLKLYSYSEVEEVSGYVGNFDVNIRKKARSVDAGKCNGCGLCQEKCPTKVPSEYDGGLGMRKAIYTLFPQAIPNIPVIDRQHCMMFTRGKCGICKKVCPLDAIDYEQKDEIITEKVGAIIVATGFDQYEPYDIEEYGYGKYKNVITGLQLERLLHASGPTFGKLKRPSDGSIPKGVAFIQCVGSRDKKRNPHCSRICCMYAIKNARLIKEEHPDCEVYVFYTDMRAYAKGYEEFYNIAQEYNIKFIRGRAAEVVELPETANLLVRAEDTLAGEELEVEVDMVVLAAAILPGKDAEKIGKILKIARGQDGFFMEAHPKLRPVDTLTDGVFLAGVSQGPKDIPDTVSQAKGAASGAAGLVSKKVMELDPIVALSNESSCRGCGRCEDTCEYGAIELREIRPGILASHINEVLCKGCGSCSVVCTSGAITMKHFTNKQTFAMIEAAMGGA